MSNKLVSLKEILSSPALRRKIMMRAMRREIMVRAIVATQAREGIVTTLAQAEAAYDKVQLQLTAKPFDTPACEGDGFTERQATITSEAANEKPSI
jgi:hypothetical protein